jgi:hypothetical protein
MYDIVLGYCRELIFTDYHSRHRVLIHRVDVGGFVESCFMILLKFFQ